MLEDKAHSLIIWKKTISGVKENKALANWDAYRDPCRKNQPTDACNRSHLGSAEFHHNGEANQSQKGFGQEIWFQKGP